MKTRLCQLIAAMFLLFPMLASASEPTPARLMPLASKAVFMAVAQSGETVLAVGERGIILRSQNGGNEWRQVPAPVDVTLTDVVFSSEQEAWAVGHGSTILHSMDAGATWQVEQHEEKSDVYYLDISFIDGTAYVLGSYGHLLTRAPGTEEWEDEVLEVMDDGFLSSYHLFGVAQLNDTTMVVGERGTVLVKTEGGQLGWQQLKTPYRGSYFGVVPFGNRFLLYGMSGMAYLFSPNEGEWTQVGTRTSQFLFDAVVSSNDDAAWLVGSGGLILEVDQDGKFVRRSATEQIQPADLISIEVYGDSVFLTTMSGGIRTETRRSLWR